MRGKANPKSSTGRIDVFTRVITDESYRFDEIADGYEGPLYLEVVPLSFPVRVREDLTLNQLRLSVGRADADRRRHPRVSPPAAAALRRAASRCRPTKLALGDGMFLGLDLRGDADGACRLPRPRQRAAARLSPRAGAPSSRAVLGGRSSARKATAWCSRPQRFYLLMSNEAVSIPPTLASEMTAYDPTSGELRTHYAGFFDPGFGYDRDAAFHGSRAALEVRAHDVPFMIEHGQRVCKLTFERMLEAPERLYGQGIGSSYQQQDETLSKHFARDARRAVARDRDVCVVAPRPRRCGGGGAGAWGQCRDTLLGSMGWVSSVPSTACACSLPNASICPAFVRRLLAARA